MKIFKLLLPSNEIPLGSTVTKPTGEKKYILRNEIKIYGSKEQIIKADEHSRFIVSDNGDINSVGDTSILCWHVDKDELIEYLNEDERNN
jgi:hypothetical protein